VNYPNGQTTSYTYLPNSGDKQLQTLQNFYPNASNLSRFDYVYDKEHMITQWTKQNDASTAQPLYFTYDGVDQLASWKNNTVPPLHGGYIHTLAYDSAGNRQTDTYDEFPGGGWDPTETRKDETFNSVNQLTSLVGADPTPPPGPGPIEFGGDGEPPPPPPTDSYTYDLNGNLTECIYGRGGGNTFEWDAANRLIAINRTVYPGIHKRTELTYDGASHRKKIVEKSSGTVIGTKQFVWVGNRIAEERDANNVVTRRYYSNGEQRIGGLDAGIYFYSKDHLGSIREMTDTAGAIRTRYDYDPFGNTTMVSGDLSVDFGYTGHYWLNTIGNNLYLAPFRAYDPTIGRWISRDSLEDAETSEGPNLYSYVRNNPSGATDPLGLATKTFTKTDGVTDWADLWSHATSHLARPWQGFGSKYGRPARVVYHNVCSDPVYKLLKSVKASNGWGAYIDGPNDAHIDVSSRRGIWDRLTWQDPAKEVSLIAECSDGCTM
jgi:RHS repeat-associated protein